MSNEHENKALVIARFGAHADIETANGEHLRCHLRKKQDVVCGDEVIWQCAANDSYVVTKVLPRRNALTRHDWRGTAKTMAANVDHWVIVIAPVPAIELTTLDRYLVAASLQDASVTLVINKWDLVVDNSFTDLEDEYTKIGYPICKTSAEKNQGLTELHQQLATHRSIFIGPSGVGKSSLLACLLPDATINIGDLVKSGQHGAHTTTTSRLYHLSGGGELIDSPGIRGFAIEHIEARQLANGFIEFKPFLGQCHFRDCLHLPEAKCAIKAAVANGAISDARYQRYLALLQDCTA